MHVVPEGVTDATRSALRDGPQAALRARPECSFIATQGDEYTVGRGVFSGTPVFFAPAAPKPNASLSLRQMARHAGAQPDAEGIRDYLGHGFVPAPRTALAAVRCLRPGEILTWKEGKEPQVESVVAPNLDGSSTPEEVWQLLTEQLHHQPPAAVLFSGGIDSACVAAAARETGRNPTALHARFPAVASEHDEDTQHARSAANAMQMPYRELRIRSTDALRLFGRLAGMLDQPYGDPVVLPFFLLLAHASAKGLRNVSTGEGGDQLCGSWSLRPMMVTELFGRGQYDKEAAYLKSFHKLAEESGELVAGRIGSADTDGWRPTAAAAEAFASSPCSDFRETIRWVDIRLKGLQHILPRIRDVGRAAGVTLHHPLFSSDLLHSSFALAPELKYAGATDKVLFRQLGADRLPDALVERRKIGMGVPTSAWFGGMMRPLVWAWLGRRHLTASGLLDPTEVRRIVKRERLPTDARRRRWGDRLWMLCMLEAWFAALRKEVRS